MSQNPLVVEEQRDQRTAMVPSPAAPSNGGVSTDTSTVINESPTFVSQTRAERIVSEAPSESGSPAASSAVATRTTLFSGDPAYRGVQVVWVLLGLVELIIALRVLFRAMNASDTGFVSLMYGLGGAFVAPFRGIANWVSGTTVIEVGSLIAMVVYGLAALLVVKVVRIAVAPSRSRMS